MGSSSRTNRETFPERLLEPAGEGLRFPNDDYAVAGCHGSDTCADVESIFRILMDVATIVRVLLSRQISRSSRHRQFELAARGLPDREGLHAQVAGLRGPLSRNTTRVGQSAYVASMVHSIDLRTAR